MIAVNANNSTKLFSSLCQNNQCVATGKDLSSGLSRLVGQWWCDVMQAWLGLISLRAEGGMKVMHEASHSRRQPNLLNLTLFLQNLLILEFDGNYALSWSMVISLSWANIYKWVSLSVVENWFAVSLTMTTCVCSFTTDPEIVGIGYNDLWFITYRFLYLHNVSLLFRLECCTIQYVWSPPDCFLVLPLPFATRATPMFGGPPMIRRPPLEYDMTSVKSSRCSRISMWMEQVHVI